MKNKGIIFILSGLLLIAAAFFLTGYNIYDEYGNLKKATVVIIISDTPAKCKFRNYKAGFDLYEIKHNGKIIFKRESK